MEEVSAKEVPGIHQGLHPDRSESPVMCVHKTFWKITTVKYFQGKREQIDALLG